MSKLYYRFLYKLKKRCYTGNENQGCARKGTENAFVHKMLNKRISGFNVAELSA